MRTDYTMMYLMRGSMREGKVAPGLWGPWTITDFSGWSDQMTLDCKWLTAAPCAFSATE